MYIELEDLLKIIQKKEMKLETEKKYRKINYGYPNNHVEILNFINKVDNDLWDGLVLGYKNFNYPRGTVFKSNKLLGIIWVENGNHKLIFKIPYMRNFSESRLKLDINKFIKEYTKINKLKTVYLDLTKFKNYEIGYNYYKVLLKCNL